MAQNDQSLDYHTHDRAYIDTVKILEAQSHGGLATNPIQIAAIFDALLALRGRVVSAPSK